MQSEVSYTATQVTIADSRSERIGHTTDREQGLPQEGSLDQHISNHEYNRAVNPRKESLFIGGMTCSTNLSELQQHLRLLAGTNSGLFISMVSRIKRRSFSGYGIIKNVDPKTAEKLLQVKNFKFQGCWYGVKPFLKKKSEILNIRNKRAQKKVYLNGLCAPLSEIDIEQHFSKFGQVLHVQISKHPGTGSYKGFGFVEFDLLESAQLALKTHHHLVNGVTLACQQTNSVKNTRVSAKASSSSSQGPMESQVPGGKLEFLDQFVGSCDYDSSSVLLELIQMSSQVAANHTLKNVAFRVRFNI